MVDRVVGVLIPPLYVGIGLLASRSRLSETAGPLVLLLSGALIGRWWAPIPSVVTFMLLGMVEVANGLGIGPGPRIGTAIEIHSEYGFSVFFLLGTVVIAIVLPLLGVGLRSFLRRRHSAY